MGIFDRSKSNDSQSGTSQGPARTVSLVKDSSGAPAVNLEKVSAGGVDLVKRYQKAGVSLQQRDLGGIRAQARLYADHSGSMEFPGAQDYSNGNVQAIVERALGFTLQIDADGIIPVIAFDSRLWPAVNVTANNYQNVVNREIWKPNRMGGTMLSLVLEDLLREAKQTDEIIWAGILTDGNPNPGDDRRSTQLVCELAAYPVFIKFLAIRPVPYLQELDDLPSSRRLIDNVDCKPEMGTSLNLRNCSDLEFANAMADEWNTWIDEARRAGIIR